MSNTRDLIAYTNRNNVLERSLKGQKPHQIAEELGLSIDTVRRHLLEALEEGKNEFINESPRLLVTKYYQLEMIISALMEDAINKDKKAIELLDKLVNTQIRMLKGNSAVTVNVNGVSQNFAIFKPGDDTFELAYEIAKNEPKMLTDPIQKFKRIGEEEGYDTSDGFIIDVLSEIPSTKD